MQRIRMPVANLNQMIERGLHCGEKIDGSVLDYAGLFILKNAMSPEIVQKYRQHYADYKVSESFDRTKFHLTEVKFPIEHPLSAILEEREFKDIASYFFDGNVGLFNIRIVKKDAVDNKPVFLHQDIGYQHGSFQRYSLFVPLTRCNVENGGLTLVPGTHKFGYLGDVGGIRNVIPPELKTVTPDVAPGDVIIMDSSLWHMSGDNTSNAERIYYDIHINHADDPATKQVILGTQNDEWGIDYSQDFLFENSRTQRIIALYKQLEAANADSKSA